MTNLSELISRLRVVSEICQSSKGTMSFEEAMTVARFYYDFQETNAVIDAAEEMAKQNPKGLKAIVMELKSEIENTLKFLPNLDGIDFNKIGRDYSDVFYDTFNAASKALAPLRKKVYHLNNRLDFLPLDSEEYTQTEKELEEAKAELEPRQKEVKEKYAVYDRELKKSSILGSFKTAYLEVLLIKLGQIAEAILTDLNHAGV